MVLQSEFVQVQTIVLSAEEGVQDLGFGISGSRNSGIVVRVIFAGGAAEREGSLRHGDHLLAVGGVRLLGMASEQVGSILRHSSGPVRIVVARPVDPNAAFLSNGVVVPTKTLADPNDLDLALEASINSASASPIALAAAAGFNLTLAESHLPDPKLELQFVNGMAIPAVTVLTADNNVAVDADRPMVENVVLPLLLNPDANNNEDDNNENDNDANNNDANYESNANEDINEEDDDYMSNHETVVASTDLQTDLTITVPPLSPVQVEPQLEVIVESAKTPCKSKQVRRSLSLLKKSERKNSKSRKMSLPNFGRRIRSELGENNLRRDDNHDDSILVLPEKEEYTVELVKDDKGLGITVAGYVCEKESLSGIFVKSVIADSMADKSGCIMVNDQITKVDGVSLSSFSNQEAVELLKCTGRVVRLTVARYFRGLTFEELHVVVDDSEGNDTKDTSEESTLPLTTKRVVAAPQLGSLSSSTPPSACSLWSQQKRRKASLPPSASQRIVDRQLLHRHSDQLHNIGQTEAADAIRDRWQRALGPDQQVIVSCFTKSSSGVGLSLEGTVDVEGGVEVRPKHYIRSVLMGGAVDKDGRLRAGDQLLEVNGVGLEDVFHDQVVAMLRALPLHVCLVCARPIQKRDENKHDENQEEKNDNENSDVGPREHLEQSKREEVAFNQQQKNVLSSSLQSLLQSKEPDLLLKACSDNSLATSEAEPALMTVRPRLMSSKMSRSLEALNATAVWGQNVEEIVLNKGPKGLGFSILDYQDPQNVRQKVIVVRSLIPGGEAALDGRLVPGDRLLYVNTVNLEHASLDAAVQALKGADFGPVAIGIAKPLIQLAEEQVLCRGSDEESSSSSTVDKWSCSSSSSSSNSTLDYSSSQSTSITSSVETTSTMTATTFATAAIDSTTPFNAEKVTVSTNTSTCVTTDTSEELATTPVERATKFGFSDISKTSTRDRTNSIKAVSSTASTSSSGTSTSRSTHRAGLRPVLDVSLLPHLPKFSVVVEKSSPENLGLELKPLFFEQQGCVIRAVEPNSALAKDKRLREGDLVLYLNHESMWGATCSQAKSILRRAHFLNAIPIVFVPAEHLVSGKRKDSDDVESSDQSLVPSIVW